MSTSVSAVVNHFPSPQNGFTTTTASTIASGAATVPLNSVAGYTNGQIVALVIEPTSATAKQTFTGTIDTAGIQVTGVKWTAGTNQTHNAGVTVVDYATATHIAMITKGLLVSHAQDGTLLTAAVNTALGLGSTALNGWTPLVGTLSTVTYNGNRSYTCVFNAVDLTATLSAGMRFRSTRTVAAPTQSTSLNGTSQYYSKTTPAGMTFTDDFVVSAWVKLSSYPSAAAGVVSRTDGTSGWQLTVETTGQIQLLGFNAGSGNYSLVKSYQSIPLNKWVHVSGQLDMSAFTATTTTSYVMIDGVDVPASVTRAGTNPTALVQTGTLAIGAVNGGASGFFPGKIAQVAIYSAKVTQATILASMNQGLAGTETSLISAYSFNNAITDLNTTNANNLTANGSAVATNADSPFGGQAGGTISSTLDYAEIVSVAFSTNTTVVVRVPEGNTIPTSGGVSAVAYSSASWPYGFPGISNVLGYADVRAVTTGTSTSAVQINGMSITATVPINRPYKVSFFVSRAYSSGSTGEIRLKLWDGAVTSGTLLQTGEQTTPVLNPQTVYIETPPQVSSTTSKTFNASVDTTAGTYNLVADVTSPMYLRVDLL